MKNKLMLANICSECYNKKLVKKRDVLLLLSVLALALFIFVFQKVTGDEGGRVEIYVDGVLQESFLLEEDRRIPIIGYQDGRNLLVIRHNQVQMEEADCPDRLCVKQGTVSRSGQSIICLPHRITVVIQSKNGNVNNGLEPDVIAR